MPICTPIAASIAPARRCISSASCATSGAEAIASLPLTARLLRPDGVEIDRRQITGDRLGAYELTYPLARDARIGSWRVEFRLDPKSPPVGTAEFRVEDFVPPQLKVALSAGDGPIVPGEAFPIGVEARYYYGAPGADLPVEAEATIAFDEAPFPSEPGFRFGLASEEFAGTRQDVEAPATDSDGKSTASLTLTDLPDLTKPLAATVRVSVVEPSGRTVTETVTRPIRQRPLAIGLRSPNGDEAVPEGAGGGSVEIIAVDPEGRRIAAKGLRWELLRETWQYDWYSVNGVWRHRTQVRDVPIEAGTLDIDGGRAGVAVPHPARRPVSLGGDRRRQRRAVEPALPCRVVGRGRDARCAGQARSGGRQAQLPAGRGRRNCSSRRRSPARPRSRSRPTASWRCARLRCRPMARRSRSRSIPVGAAAFMPWSAPIGPPPLADRNRAVPGARSASPGSASIPRRGHWASR